MKVVSLQHDDSSEEEKAALTNTLGLVVWIDERKARFQIFPFSHLQSSRSKSFTRILETRFQWFDCGFIVGENCCWEISTAILLGALSISSKRTLLDQQVQLDMSLG